ncbi:hypothetical protein H6P81_010366 [Aristolochia fimbriata]|uniref:Uncharacterized protein n=1 Tax=Aristolochia fimbriata TaxID=158543 RepID=A0AAV7ERF9_ARIFI|nr:hypothetical protein H6P81_010366 [Aristolochia fimbriata]
MKTSPALLKRVTTKFHSSPSIHQRVTTKFHSSSSIDQRAPEFSRSRSHLSSQKHLNIDPVFKYDILELTESMEKKGNMGLLSAGGPKFATVLLLIACLVPKLAESRVQLLLHHPSPGSSILELQRYGRELLGSRSFEITNPPPAGNPIKRRNPPPEPGPGEDPYPPPPPDQDDCDYNGSCEKLRRRPLN